MMKQLWLRSIGVACAVACSASPLAAHDPPTPHELTIGAKHPSRVDEARFFTNRDVPALPLPEETGAFTFAIFGDRTGGPADGVEVLAQAVKDVNLFEPDLVMTVGDLVEGYNETDEWLKQMREYKSIMDDLICPWFPVAGNHDIYWRGPTQPPQEHEGDFEAFFGPLWYGFEHKNCGFIVLYSDECNPDTGERNFNKPECQTMSPEQVAWLEGALERTTDLKHVFVFLHHPRWQKGNYGNDWDRVHALLAGAGNVRAVFAGHIHIARYDGCVDGIEYVTLATVGGVQTGVAPRAGYLHHFNIVTVRPTQIAMSMIPVGEVMNIRTITSEVSSDARRLAQVLPQATNALQLHQDGSADAIIVVPLTNPVGRPIDVTLIPDADDSRWSFAPDHDHAVIEPGGTHSFQFAIHRSAAGIDDSIRLPVIRRQLDYLAEGARFEMPELAAPVPIEVFLAQPTVPAVEHALRITSREHYKVASSEIALPDGPMTLECFFKGDDFAGRRGLVNKTENAEYGFLIYSGVPAFYLHIAGKYVELMDRSIVLERGRWYHIAGVYDGIEARLYLNGKLIERKQAVGERTRNELPLIVGADVNPQGEAVNHFTGMVDAVHLSSIARYEGDHFTPTRRPTADDHTLLLLNMDAAIGPWLYDESQHATHPVGDGAVTAVAD